VQQSEAGRGPRRHEPQPHTEGEVMELETIVVGFDGSANARRALQAAIDLSQDKTTVHVVTAFDPPSAEQLQQILHVLPEEYRTGYDLLEGPRGELRDAEHTLENHGIKHEGHFVSDKPAAAILDVAEEVDADLIVVGSRGLGRATRFLRGSVSSRIAAHAPRSFLVIHDEDES
jgi:nucleotide-binding universal stress UspA family protein